MKSVQENESIMGVRDRWKNPSLAITVWHHMTSLVMPDSDPRDGCFYLPLTPMIDPYTADRSKAILLLQFFACMLVITVVQL